MLTESVALRWGAIGGLAALVLTLGRPPEVSSDSLHYATCSPVPGGCNNGWLYGWLLQATSPHFIVALQSVVFAVAVVAAVFVLVDSWRGSVRFTGHLALVAVITAPAFSSWQRALLTDGLAISLALLALALTVRWLQGRSYMVLALLVATFVIMSGVRAAAAVYGSAIIALVLLVCWLRGIERSRSSLASWALASVVIIALSAPVLVAQGERYEVQNAAKRDMTLGAASPSNAEVLDGQAPGCDISRSVGIEQVNEVIEACPQRKIFWSMGNPSVVQVLGQGGPVIWFTEALPRQLAVHDYRLPETAPVGWPAVGAAPREVPGEVSTAVGRLVLPVALAVGLMAWSRDPEGVLRPLGLLAPVGIAVAGFLMLLPWMVAVWVVDPYEPMRHALPWTAVVLFVGPAVSPWARRAQSHLVRSTSRRLFTASRRPPLQGAP